MIKKEELIINSIVFKNQLENGLRQMDLLGQIDALGFKRFEVRREFIRDGISELVALKEKADQLGLTLFYSVNEDLIVNDELNPHLDRLIKETTVLSAPFLKVNIGDASNVTPQTLQPVNALLPKNMLLFVENNQDPHHASLANCYQFMTIARQTNLPIHFVFDTANWAFVGENLSQAALKMGAFTKYLHCKNYYTNERGLETSNSLLEGEIDMVRLIQSFQNISYLALEYPTTIEQVEADAESLMNQLS